MPTGWELKKVFEATNVPFPVLVLAGIHSQVDANQQELEGENSDRAGAKRKPTWLNRLVKRDSKHQPLSNEPALKQFL